MRSRSFLSCTVGAIAVSMVAACGGSPTSAPTADDDSGAVSDAASQVYDEVMGLSGQERIDALTAGAEEEGALSIYTSNTDIGLLVDGFTELYDIEVDVYRATSESVLQRVLQEQQAGFYGNDLWEDNPTNLSVGNDEGFLAEYGSEGREQVREEGQQENWTANRFTVFVVGWNTDLVPPGEEPASLAELAEPQWEGRVAIELNDVDWFAAMYQYYVNQGQSEAEVEEMFARIAANSKVVKGHTVQGELLSAGQFAVAPSIYSHTIDKAADIGAPVQWRPESGEPVQPVVTRPNGAGLMKTATHPYAATLFMDYMLSPEGQAIITDGFRVGSVENPESDPLEGLEVITVPVQEILDNSQQWNELYASIVEGHPTSG